MPFLKRQTDWPVLCGAFEDLLEDYGGELSFNELRKNYKQRFGYGLVDSHDYVLEDVISQYPFCEVMEVVDGVLHFLPEEPPPPPPPPPPPKKKSKKKVNPSPPPPPQINSQVDVKSLADALRGLQVDLNDGPASTAQDAANPQTGARPNTAAAAKIIVASGPQMILLQDELARPRAPGRDFIVLNITEDGKAVDLAFSPASEGEGWETAPVAVYSLPASFIEQWGDARRFLRELLVDPGEIKVTYDCYRLAPLLRMFRSAPLQSLLGAAEGEETDDFDDDVAWLAAAAQAPPASTGLIDLQLAVEHEGGPHIATLPRCVAFLRRADWAVALGKSKSIPAALLRAGEALQRRQGWGPLGGAGGAALAAVRQATALRMAMVRRAMRLERRAAAADSDGDATTGVGAPAGTRPLMFDPEQKRLVSAELVLLRGGQASLAGTALVVHQDVESLYGIVPLRLFEAAEPAGSAEGDDGPIQWQDPSISNRLIEIVLDLGKRPRAKLRGQRQPAYLHRDLSVVVEAEDLEQLMFSVGSSVGHDHRAGIDGTLHRISIMFGREPSQVLGATLRCGRHVTGNSETMRDLMHKDPDKLPSILVVGPPGTGKTTIIREIARLLSTDFCIETIIIDTSNEIAGDGLVPHSCVGNARRMMVRSRDNQADVMIEAVQNHMPELMIIDEIGRLKEVQAALTCKERGVAMIGSAHGSFFSLLHNKQLVGMLGGIATSTIGDKAAKKNKGRKNVAERAHLPVFDIVVELRRGKPEEMTIYRNVGAIVDAHLKGQAFSVERRFRHPGAGGLIHVARVTSEELRREQGPLLGEADIELKQEA